VDVVDAVDSSLLLAFCFFDDADVFVASAGEVHHGDGAARQFAFLTHEISQGVGALQRRQYTFEPADQAEGVEDLTVFSGDVPGPAGIFQIAVLGSDRRVIKTRADRLRVEDLPVLILEQ